MVKEKYLPYVPPEKPEQPPKTEKELRKEKWENFWFYHKWAILIPVISVFVLTMAILLVKPDSKPDLTVFLVTTQKWEEKERITELEELLCPYLPDLGGDSIVNIEAKQYVFDPANPDAEAKEKLLKAINESETYFFICDEVNAKWLAEEGILAQFADRGKLAKDAEKLEEYAMKWSDNKLFQNDYFFSQMEPYYFCLRYFTDNGSSDNANAYYWSTSMLQFLMKNSPLDQNYFDSLWTYQDKCWESYGKDTSRPVVTK